MPEFHNSRKREMWNVKKRLALCNKRRRNVPIIYKLWFVRYYEMQMRVLLTTLRIKTERKTLIPGPTSSSPWAPSSHRSPTPTGPPRPWTRTWSRQHILEHNQHHGLSIDSRGREEGTDGNTARKLYSYTSESTFGIKSSLVWATMPTKTCKIYPTGRCIGIGIITYRFFFWRDRVYHWRETCEMRLNKDRKKGAYS